jgi:hypothetical protein
MRISTANISVTILSIHPGGQREHLPAFQAPVTAGQQINRADPMAEILIAAILNKIGKRNDPRERRALHESCPHEPSVEANKKLEVIRCLFSN